MPTTELSCPPSPLPLPNFHRPHQNHHHQVTALPAQSTGTKRLRQIHAHLLRANIRQPHAWNTLARAYVADGAAHLALLVCLHMPHQDHFTFPLAFKLCSHLSAYQEAACLHAHLLKLGLVHVHSLNALLTLYSHSGQLDSARKLFDKIPKRTVSSWTSMISALDRNSLPHDAIQLYRAMQMAGVHSDEATLVTVLSACTRCGCLDFGKLVHAHAIVSGMGHNLVALATALVDMYAKSGAIKMSREVFKRMVHRNVLSWSAMISGLAIHGLGTEALELFEEMMNAGLMPTSITMTNVLSACSHAGLVEDGLKYFKFMKNGIGIEPEIEHYGCMVDLLGRAGLLREAYEFMKLMPIDPPGILWRSLLGSACTHGNLKMGELAMDQLAQMEDPVAGDYVMLANLYARFGQWEDVGKVRTTMNDLRMRKAAGYSLIELNGVVYKFVMGDRSHPQSHLIYEMLGQVSRAILIKTVASIEGFVNFQLY